MEGLREAVRTHLSIEVSAGSPGAYLWHAFSERHAPEVASDCVVWANRGGGKTYLGALATALDLLFKPGIQIRILAGSLDQAGRMHAHLRALFAHPLLMAHVKGRITDTRLELVNTSRVELLAQSQTSVRGTRVHKLRCDEVELFDPEVWEAAQLVTRSETLGPFHVRGSIEAMSTMHRSFGLMKRIVEECHQGRRTLFKWGVIDVLERCPAASCVVRVPRRAAPAPIGERNGSGRVCDRAQEHGAAQRMDVGAKEVADEVPCPLLEECGGRAREAGWAGGHLGIDDAIRMKGRVPRDVWRAEMCCTEPSRSDTVLPEFDASIHVVREIPGSVIAEGEWIGGMDFGVRQAVVLWAVRDRASDVVYVVDERVTSGALIGDHVDAILNGAWPKPAWIGVDPAGNQRSEQTGVSSIHAMRQRGLVIRESQSRVADGIGLVRTRLRSASGRVSLFVHERCQTLVGAMTKHHYDPRHPHNPVPVKDGSDHPVDALRYMMLHLDGRFETKESSYVP
jgi:hypothetical protein